MKVPIFEYPSYFYQLDDWNFKKKALLNHINSQKFIRSEIQNFESDRYTNNQEYSSLLKTLIDTQLSNFYSQERECYFDKCWTARYKKGDYQIPHIHRSWGFSGVLYVEYDKKVHTPTFFICPWQNPITEFTNIVSPEVEEGTMVIFPSNTLHYTNPNNSNKRRTVISFDLIPK